MAKYSPVIEQFLQIKEKYPDTIILFRLGDFYELFFEDAKIASKELDLLLTGKDAGTEERVPMCGMPYHAVNGYIEKLVKNGHKIGIVEQVEDPATAKKLVKRDVVQIVTPGTIIDVGLNEKANNYICYLEKFDFIYVLSYCDISTGEIYTENIDGEVTSLINELKNLDIKELVINPNFDLSIFEGKNLNIAITPYTLDNEFVSYDFITKDLKDVRQIKVVTILVDYLTNTQKRNLDYFSKVQVIKSNLILKMDYFTRTNLELLQTLRSDNSSYGSLLWVLDKTKTAMGARKLKSFICRPLASITAINERLDLVEAFIKDLNARNNIRTLLNEVYDLPRIIGKIGFGNANARDLVQLKKSLLVIPSIKEYLINNKSLVNLGTSILNYDSIVNLIDTSIVEDPPFSLKDGGLIKPNFSNDLDELKDLSRNGKKWISEFEAKEREKTGIKNLKVGYNKVFGFYIEVTNSFKELVKEEYGYIRKQTTINSERYICQELKEKEDAILNAEERIVKLEYDLFQQIRLKIKEDIVKLQNLADTIAYIDVLVALAQVSFENNYVRPILQEQRSLEIKDGRHPVLEQISNGNFIPNDIYLDSSNYISLITGPNMGGKSTYMKQIAIIIIMAQIGCFVPASYVKLPVFDAIYTRIGASDDLVMGQSTFMVEMLEANNAIKNATSNSFIIFDEIGRGTSTYDGMALAQSILEYLATSKKVMTLFSTHYHELTKLEGNLQGISNYYVDVYEENDEITFLYKVKKGCANKSYGINVARLALLPDDIIDRAKVLLDELQISGANNGASVKYVEKVVYKESDIEQKINDLDPLNMTPMEALNALYQLKKNK